MRLYTLALQAVKIALPLFFFFSFLMKEKESLRKNLRDDNEVTINVHSNYKHAM